MTTLTAEHRATAPHPAYLAQAREDALLWIKHSLSDRQLSLFADGDLHARIAAELENLRATGITPGDAALMLDGIRTAKAALAALAVTGEGWTGSGSCSDCYRNHPGPCTCGCHTRWSASTVQRVTSGQDFPVLTPPPNPAKPPHRTGTAAAA